MDDVWYMYVPVRGRQVAWLVMQKPWRNQEMNLQVLFPQSSDQVRYSDTHTCHCSCCYEFPHELFVHRFWGGGKTIKTQILAISRNSILPK